MTCRHTSKKNQQLLAVIDIQFQQIIIGWLNFLFLNQGPFLQNLSRYFKKMWRLLRNTHPPKPQLKPLVDPRNLTLDHFDIYDETGIFVADFKEIFLALPQDTFDCAITSIFGVERRKKNTTFLKPTIQLLMVLAWLRRYPYFAQLARVFFVSKTTTWRIVTFLLPRVLLALQSDKEKRIQFPTKFKHYKFENVVGAIDCSSHFRDRVHPYQGDYYRSDKHGHFLTSQVICDLDGSRIFSVHLGLGHNNDRGMWKRSFMNTFFMLKNEKLLGDGGYSGVLLVCPDDKQTPLWNSDQKSLRSVVETVIGLSHNWAVANTRFKPSPEKQELALLIIYELVNRKLQKVPLGIRPINGKY